MSALAIAAMLFACGTPEEEEVNAPEQNVENPGNNPGGNDDPGNNDDPGTGDDPGTVVKGDLQFLGSIADGASFSYDYTAHENVDLGYWYAQVRTQGGAWQTMEASEPSNAAFYKDVTFSITDKATGAPAEWCSVAYGNVEGVINSTHWILNVSENTGSAARIALVKAEFPASADGYVLLAGLETLSIEVVQNKKLAEGEIIGEMTFANITSRGGEYKFGPDAVAGQNLFYDAVQVRANGSSAWQTIEANTDETIYKEIGITVTDDADGNAASWCQVLRRDRDTWLYANIEANTGAERSATVTVTFPSVVNGYKLLDGEGSYVFKISQQAYVKPVDLDYNSASNLWKAVDAAGAVKFFYYYAPNYQPLPGCNEVDSVECPFLTRSGSSYILDLATPTTDIWNTQFFIYPFDSSHFLALDQNKKYTFQVVLNSELKQSAYFKLDAFATAGPKHEGAVIWDKGVVDLPAGKDVVLQKIGFTGTGCDNIILVFGLGGNNAANHITIKDIILMEAE